MGQSEAMTGARGQITWIGALVLSTTAIIYLERLDIGTPGRSSVVSADMAATATSTLAAAEQDHQASPKDAGSATALLLALSVAVQAGAVDAADAKARVAALRAQSAGAPGSDAVRVLTDLTFGQ